LSLENIRSAIAGANVDEAKGNFDGAQQAYTIGANDQLLSSADYRPLIVAYHNGAPVRLSDVANVIDDAENVKQAAWMNTVPAVILNVQRQPGANIITVVDKVKALLPRLRSAPRDTIVVADGTSCRQQIRDGSGREAVHVARLLETALA
jgi:multidrug efflux pump